jgi:hypothetical protein
LSKGVTSTYIGSTTLWFLSFYLAERSGQIDDLIDQLKMDGIVLNCKGTAEGYLGVDIKQDGRKSHYCKKY